MSTINAPPVASNSINSVSNVPVQQATREELPIDNFTHWSLSYYFAHLQQDSFILFFQRHSQEVLTYKFMSCQVPKQLFLLRLGLNTSTEDVWRHVEYRPRYLPTSFPCSGLTKNNKSLVQFVVQAVLKISKEISDVVTSARITLPKYKRP